MALVKRFFVQLGTTQYILNAHTCQRFARTCRISQGLSSISSREHACARARPLCWSICWSVGWSVTLLRSELFGGRKVCEYASVKVSKCESMQWREYASVKICYIGSTTKACTLVYCICTVYLLYMYVSIVGMRLMTIGLTFVTVTDDRRTRPWNTWLTLNNSNGKNKMPVKLT